MYVDYSQLVYLEIYSPSSLSLDLFSQVRRCSQNTQELAFMRLWGSDNSLLSAPGSDFSAKVSGFYPTGLMWVDFWPSENGPV
jgi:hypothetical protein